MRKGHRVGDLPRPISTLNIETSLLRERPRPSCLGREYGDELEVHEAPPAIRPLDAINHAFGAVGNRAPKDSSGKRNVFVANAMAW
jgi:hypothetical protein